MPVVTGFNIIEVIVGSRENISKYTQYFMLYIFYFMVALTNVFYFIKNGAAVNNSASYVINRKMSRFIDKLAS